MLDSVDKGGGACDHSSISLQNETLFIFAIFSILKNLI